MPAPRKRPLPRSAAPALPPALKALRKRPKWTISLCLMLFLVLSFSYLAYTVIHDSHELSDAINRHTEQYVADVCAEMAYHINSRLEAQRHDLQMLAHVAITYGLDPADETLQRYLREEGGLAGFSYVCVTNVAGASVDSDTAAPDLPGDDGYAPAWTGVSDLRFLPGGNLMLTIPIYNGAGEVSAVARGVRAITSIRDSFLTERFSGLSATCIINTEGEVQLKARDMRVFSELNALFDGDPDVSLADSLARIREGIRQGKGGAIRFTAPDGRDVVLDYHPLAREGWVLLTLVSADVLSNGINVYMNQTFTIMLVIVGMMAVTVLASFIARDRHSRRMERATLLDPVTGGINAQAFLVCCQRLLPALPPNSCTLLMFNIKNFKVFNHLFGIEASNDLLRMLMRIFTARVGKDGLVARGDIDVFYLLLRTGSHAEVDAALAAIARDVEAEMARFNESRVLPYHLVLNSGAYIVDDPKKEVRQMMDFVRMAANSRTPMEEGVCKYYDALMMDRLVSEQELNDTIAQALENGEIIPYLQPKVRIEDGSVAGVEVLARWKHPAKGMLSPSRFVPLFESNGRINEIDLYIFETACREMRRLIDAGNKPIKTSVNMSRCHFRVKDFMRRYLNIAQKYRVPAGLIEFELTESVLFDLENLDTVRACIEEMHKNGFLVSLDDFGSGYSSLGLLMELDVDTIKLDKRFFLNVGSPKTRSVVASIVEMARRIGATIVAEGIETEEQLAFAREVNCDVVQGFIYARPMPLEGLEDWLQSRSW